MKVYVVFAPKRHRGIYPTWDECRRKVEGVSGALYKSFPTRRDAELALGIKPKARVTYQQPPPPPKEPIRYFPPISPKEHERFVKLGTDWLLEHRQQLGTITRVLEGVSTT